MIGLFYNWLIMKLAFFIWRVAFFVALTKQNQQTFVFQKLRVTNRTVGLIDHILSD